MPQPSDQPSSPESDYPILTLPEGGWQSNIPAHLLDGASKADVWLMQEMSKNTQATEFCGRAAIESNGLIRKTNGRLKGAEYHIIELKTEIAALKADNVMLKERMEAIHPIVRTVGILKAVFSSKISWFVLGCFILFLLGYNRDVLPLIAKALFGG